jgi:NAD(P)-dependent dehydrogenase (short-subunit alcohol dehydrogenase family)
MPKTIVITGASDGIGAAGARQLHQDGHRVVFVGRSPAKTQAIAGELGAECFLADFTRLDDVRTLAAALDRACPRIDVLVNNAGGIFGDRAKTADGFEKTFQVNHLAPFLLTTAPPNSSATRSPEPGHRRPRVPRASEPPTAKKGSRRRRRHGRRPRGRAVSRVAARGAGQQQHAHVRDQLRRHPRPVAVTVAAVTH